MSEREVACAAVAVPPGIAERVAGYRWARNRVGESGGAVYRLYGCAGSHDLYLKHGTGSVAEDIVAEMVRLRWLDGRCAVPAVAGFVAADGAAWLLTTALAGKTAYQRLCAAPERAAAIVDAVTAFLRELHAIPVDACPFNADHRHRLYLARRRIDAGSVDETDFDAERAGWSAQQVWDALHAAPLRSPDRVVTHGDFSLDNMLLDGERVTGCIDVGRVGIADRYQDLAILAHSLGEFGAELPERMFAGYGIAAPDRCKLDFHLLLDELF